MDMNNCLTKRKLKTVNNDKRIDKMKIACFIVVTGDF